MRKVKFNTWIEDRYDLDPMDEKVQHMYSSKLPDKEKYPNAVLIERNHYETDFPNTGYFHGWGCSQQDPLAIIEDESGRVYQVQTMNVIFIENPPPLF